MAYTQKEIDSIFNSICSNIENGMSLRAALKNNNGLSSQTFYKWLDSSSEKSKQYARATELRQEAMFEEILDIADSPQEGITRKETDKGVEITTSDMIQHRRLQVDARKWMLGKMNPKKYGDKLDLSVDDKRLSPEERDARIKELLAKAKGNE